MDFKSHPEWTTTVTNKSHTHPERITTVINKSHNGELLAPTADIASLQTGALHRLHEIINAPLTGDEAIDYMTRRNQTEAAGVLLRVRTRMMLEADGSRPKSFTLPPLERPDDAVQAQAATIRAVANGQLTPAEGADVSKMITAWVASMKATRLNPLKEKGRCDGRI
jgi:hypothetical protein